jgi:hypothetical protein
MSRFSGASRKPVPSQLLFFAPEEMEGKKAVLIDFDFAAHRPSSYLLWFAQVKQI